MTTAITETAAERWLDAGKPAAIHAGISFGEYVGIPAINVSTLLYFAGRTDKGAHWKMTHPGEETKARLIGHAAHTAILEPDIYGNLYCTTPPFGDLRSPRNREARDAWLAENADKACLTEEQAAQIGGMANALDSCQDPEIRELMDGAGQNELTIVWRDPATGLLCKGRIDRLTRLHGGPVLLDLKTDRGIADHEIERSLGSYGYHVRAAWYMDALNLVKPTPWRYIWLWLLSPTFKDGVAQEAYEVRATECDDHAYAEGRAAWRQYLDRYARCLETGQWPSYRHGIEVVNPPRWAYRFTSPETL